MPRVFDCFPFFNEMDVLEVRLAELGPLVDFFVIIEATHTHTGKPKPLYFVENRERYARFDKKIIHVVVEDLPLESPDHMTRDIFQRKAIMRGLNAARPEDRIIISDCDEIPKPEVLRRALALPGLSHRIIAFWCENYFYRFNLRNDHYDHRLGPRLLTMGSLECPQVIRDIPFRFSKRWYLRPLAELIAFNRVSRRMRAPIWPTIIWNGAWHFTYMGDLNAVNHKLVHFAHAAELDALTETSYRDHFNSLIKCPLSDLPATIRDNRFAHLVA